jgi:uncharacterized protein
VFVDTSAFYAALTSVDPFHSKAANLFMRARNESWRLVTTNYVVHESWALIQKRFGWPAMEALLTTLLPMCEIHFITADLHEKAVEQCRREHLRSLSLTDCSSFQVMISLGIKEAIARDQHFERHGFKQPT